MSDRSPLPPVRLASEPELARDALATPLLSHAARLARWAEGGTRADADGLPAEDQLSAAAGVLGLSGDDAAARTNQAWRIAVDTGLVEATDEEAGTVAAGAGLGLLTGGSPHDVLAVWLTALESVLADAGGPGGEAEFLDGVLANLYLLTVGEGGPGGGLVPLPVLAASVLVPDDMGEPTDDMLRQVSEAMMRLDEQFRLLEPVGLVAYRPVDEEVMADTEEEPPTPADEADVARYGMVRLTPLGLYGLRARLLKAGHAAPVVGDFADKGADALLDGTAAFPPAAAHAETEQWLARREPVVAARELLAAARGTDPGAPLRRLRCQQALSLVGAEAEPALREVLDDAELGGLARVWLTERGLDDVPAPSQKMIFWLTIDTVAAQLAAEGDSEELHALVKGLAEQHSGFFAAAWRVHHPQTADVLEAMGRLHPDKKIAKEARKAAFKTRSAHGG
ncbi:hypothetical protein [Streptomyces triticisoli]|uniref:hypothetical protein n=1 Tax=Streptomyces triticisoli TaxID=2182797 RepID=UPI000DD66D76|nr:hypothetical protein [Streptomyces triticisoli]